MKVDDWGEIDPRNMPDWFFPRHAKRAYGTAVRANIAKQNCSICPRYWYLDISIKCAECQEEFVFSSAEQKTWYENYGFWIESVPKRCLSCRKSNRARKETRKVYDSKIALALEKGDINLKVDVANVIDTLYEYGGDLPDRISDNRKCLSRQIERLSNKETK